MFNLGILLIMGVINPLHASPFQLTEDYINEFKVGVENLKKQAIEHQFIEETYDPSHHNLTEAITEAGEFDFVIIGAGAAGAVIANRLSEIPEWKVLLLEAGGDETPYTQVPMLAPYLWNTPYNWGYVTTPQKNWCKGMIEGRCSLEMGKALGGGTAINGMLFTRGNEMDYDLWADLGNEGWCYNDVLPIFKKMEDADLEEFDHKYHNRGGPFHVEHNQYMTHWSSNVLKGGKELGLETVDYNGKTQLGLGLSQLSTKHGTRQSTNQAYLQPVKNRPNLTIKPHSRVVKIHISPHTKEARHVEYLHDGHLHIAKAHKEIILSAGGINTPQLLMLSGVGPKEELERVGIPLLVDLPVGRHMKDHIGFAALDYLYNSTETQEGDPFVEYLKEGKGILSSSHCQIIGYLHTSSSKSPTTYPDIELFFNSKTFKKPSPNSLRFKDEIYENLWKELDQQHAINIGVMLAHPKSTGTVTLKDKDPLHHPLIDPNQLSDPDDHDLETLLAGIRKAQAFAHTEPMKKIGLTINPHMVPGCEGHKWDSDEYWKCAIQHLSISLRHVHGTARMGPKTDKTAVVDNKLKVYGVEKLRVADSSVIPITITGHTMAPAIMIGEKASELIKHDWK